MKKRITALLFLCAFHSQAFEVEKTTYSINDRNGHDLSAILKSGARNLSDPNCIRHKLFNNYIHASNLAMGCYVESIEVKQSAKSKLLDVAFTYMCPAANRTSSVVYQCQQKIS